MRNRPTFRKLIEADEADDWDEEEFYNIEEEEEEEEEDEDDTYAHFLGIWLSDCPDNMILRKEFRTLAADAIGEDPEDDEHIFLAVYSLDNSLMEELPDPIQVIETPVGDLYIGSSFKRMKDDETKRAFKTRVLKGISKVLTKAVFDNLSLKIKEVTLRL